MGPKDNFVFPERGWEGGVRAIPLFGNITMYNIFELSREWGATSTPLDPCMRVDLSIFKFFSVQILYVLRQS